MTIHEKDRQLLNILSENARMPVAVLARRLGVARTTVQARLDRLEEEGVIAGYALRLSDSYLEGQVRAHVMIVLTEKALGRVVQALRDIPEISAVHSVSGSVDLIAEVTAPSISDLDRIIDSIGELDGVARTQSSVILSTRFQR
ncbi:Lrp/AsnC family transcriptional regulator [Lutimaribacter marinistellae]|uniref:Lrp/AsnC family transcriptional regulator n=1 Tax=Lutimaribacter marinistellae TaxID=1820329 RepID=A0ABV7TCW7_9RHOB